MLPVIWGVFDPTSVVLCEMNGVSVDCLCLITVLTCARDGLMSLGASCKPGTGLTVGLGTGERLISKNPVPGLCTLVTIPRYPCLVPSYRIVCDSGGACVQVRVIYFPSGIGDR